MKRLFCLAIVSMTVLTTMTPVAVGQRSRPGRDPHVGYVYPAGGRVGTTVDVTIGGQYLDDVSALYVTGNGVRATIVKHVKPITQREVNILRDKIEKSQEKLKEAGKKVNVRQKTGDYAEFLEILEEMGADEEDLKAMDLYRKRRADPKRQLNPQISETVEAQLIIDQDAAPGTRELRLRTPSGLSSPLWIQIDRLAEYRESEPNDAKGDDSIQGPLPAIVNGQIMPGDVDRFRFEASRGTRLVVAASARVLMPYLADAVPGWFQATLALYDADGKEVAYDDDFQFHPDPVLYYRIPEDGFYELEIKDSIYRGREDFVYRIKMGQLPFITSIFPLGGQKDQSTTVALKGWNLPIKATLTLDAEMKRSGMHEISFQDSHFESNHMPFVVNTLSEYLDEEPNDTIETAQQLYPPLIVNGRIDQPGDRDVFWFKGRAGGKVMIQVLARHLNSPLDSKLKLTDAQGHQLAFNDDWEDRAAGLTTHHADSLMLVTLPADGNYHVHLADTQKKGGAAYGYRLRISARRRDFELRVGPSTINARPGAMVPLTVHALRRDDFSGDITVVLKDPPPGFDLSDDTIPADEEKVELMLSVPPTAREAPFSLTLEGRADFKGREIVKPFVPADDMMQAFIYHHLVPSSNLLVVVSDRAKRWAAGGPAGGDSRLRIPIGGMVRYQLALPNMPNINEVKVALKKPPKGVVIRRVVHGLGGLVMLLGAEPGKAKPGMQGILHLQVYIEKTVPPQDGKPATKRREPIGKFPPVPYEVTGK